MTHPGQDTNPSQVSLQQKLVLILNIPAETGTHLYSWVDWGKYMQGKVRHCSRAHNAVFRPGFELTTFGLRVKYLAQGHTTQWTGWGSNSQPLGYEWSALLKDTQHSGQAGVRTHDLWVMRKTPCSRTHNTVDRLGFELSTFGEKEGGEEGRGRRTCHKGETSPMVLQT